MKAAVVKEYGGPDAIGYEDVPFPEVQQGEILIRVASSTLNPADALIYGGALQEMFQVDFPYTPGLDVAGLVEQVGSGVTTFAPGDRVFGFLDMTRGGGAAEYVVTTVPTVAKAPTTCSLGEAAAFASSGLTAWQALFDHAQLKEGQRVLITASAGGVGVMAVQLAKAQGAYVIGTASPQRFEMLKGLGADEVVDYSADILSMVAEPVDVIINLAPFTSPVDPLLQLLKKDGILVSATLPADVAEAERLGVHAIQMAVQHNAEQLGKIASLVDQGKAKAVISERFPIAATAEAHGKVGSTYAKVLLIADESLAVSKG